MNAGRSWLMTIGLAIVAQPAVGQVVDRGVSVTGPGGRTVERDIRRERHPGEVARGVTIQRPAGGFHRELSVQRGGGPLPPASAPAPAPMPGSYGYGRAPRSNIFIERNVFVERPSSPMFGVAPFFSFFFHAGPPAPPPPPMVVVPQPVAVVPAPVVVAPPPAAAPAPVQPAFDPYADALGRLSSRHHHSRRDGALTLGRIGDPRAVPALMDLLQNDRETEVRVAAAQALGSIGDPRASGLLEQAALHDRRREVRQAASQAYARIPEAAASAAEPAPTAARAAAVEPVPPPPAPATELPLITPPAPAPGSAGTP